MSERDQTRRGALGQPLVLTHVLTSKLTCVCVFPVYHALYLEELTAAELIRKLASVCSLPLGNINQVYRQGPTGIHILLSDQMVYNLPDESCFLIHILKGESPPTSTCPKTYQTAGYQRRAGSS